MTEYINRETAISKLTALNVIEPNVTMVGAKRLLAEIPAADVAPVVRCKDCKYNRGSKKCLNPDSFLRCRRTMISAPTARERREVLI